MADSLPKAGIVCPICDGAMEVVADRVRRLQVALPAEGEPSGPQLWASVEYIRLAYTERA
jgi:hypothetical protein